jgi:ABC-2 type transport system permease protein
VTETTWFPSGGERSAAWVTLPQRRPPRPVVIVVHGGGAVQDMKLLVFPLTLVSSAYVPVESMPGWLQPVAEHQPITVIGDAVGSLTQGPTAEALLGHNASYSVVWSLLLAAGIVVVFAPLAPARYRHDR